MPTVKNIYILYEKGLDVLASHVQDALEQMLSCFPRYKDNYPIEILGDWKSDNYSTQRKDGSIMLNAFESAEWYIHRARHKANLDNRWQKGRQISAEQLWHDLNDDPYAQKTPQWKLFITKYDMYLPKMPYCMGVTKEDSFSVISTARFLEKDNQLDLENFKTYIMHEFGHIIHLVPQGRVHTEDNLGPQCTNYGCVMRKISTLDSEDITQIRRDRKRYNFSLCCQDCLKAGNAFFAKQQKEYNIAHNIKEPKKYLL